MPVSTVHLTDYLNSYLRVSEVSDSPEALNGLQLESADHVNQFAVAVDACQASIDSAAKLGVDLLLVHHGLFWSGLQPLTGRHGRRIRTLVESGVALYSAHIPLDLHPTVGNNACIARALGAQEIEWFGDYLGERLGAAVALDRSLEQLVAQLSEFLGVVPKVIASGPKQVAKVGIISGGGGDMIDQARQAGVDTFITGEGKHHTYFDAEEWGLNLVYAGHYATETVGVKALATHVGEKFDLPWHYIDHPTGL